MVDESIMCSAVGVSVGFKSFWVALTGEGEAKGLNDIRRLNKWKAIQQSAQFLPTPAEASKKCFL